MEVKQKTMLGVITWVLVVCWLGLLPVVAVAQLPPEILADSYLLQVEQAIRDGDSSRAWTKIQSVLRLKEDHDLDLPEFDFWYAKSADSVDYPEKALEAVMGYLTVSGREGKHYIEALKLMNKLESEVSCKGWEMEGYFKKTTIKEVSSCLATGIDIEARNHSGLTPLHRAAAHSANPAVVEALLKARADLEAQDNNDYTPLVFAVIHNENPRVIEILLKAGANPKKLSSVLETSATNLKKLERALEPVVSQMAEREAEFQYRSETLALMKSVQSLVRCKGWETEDYFRLATLEEVSACLETGVDLEMRDEKNATPLHRVATQTEYPAVVKALLKAGSHPMRQDKDGRTPLHLAAEHNDNPGIIQALLDVGADAKAEDKSGYTPLHYAARSTANLSVVEELIAAGADPLARKSRAETGELRLGEENSYSFIGRAGQEVILDAQARGFNPNIVMKSPSGKKSFGHYLRQGKFRREILSLVLNETGEYQVHILRYADVDKSKNTAFTLHIVQDTPLGLAIQYNESLAVIEALLKAVGTAGWENRLGQTILHRAARYNENPTVIDFLLSTAEGLMKRDALGRTPLHYGARNRNPDIIEALLATGADPKVTDGNKWGLLHHAAAYNDNPAVIQVLLDVGTNLEKKADVGDYGAKLTRSTNAHPPLYHGFRALHLAAIYNDNPDITKVLLNAGAKLRPSAGYYNDTPLRWAARYNNNPAVIKTLIESGAELHDRTYESGARAVHYAAINENPAVVQMLLDAGADLNAKSSHKRTPLHYAAAGNRNPTVIELLLEVGVDLEARDAWKGTPLHRAAASSENPQVIEVLLKAGADLAARDKDEWTALHYAAYNNENPAVIEALINAGADLAALDEDGRTPLSLANEHNNYPAVREALLTAGAGQVEKQIAAEKAKRKSQSGGGAGWAALVAGVTGTAIGAAGGLDAATATELGAAIGGSVLAGEADGAVSSGGSSRGGYPSTPNGPEGSSSGFGEALRNLENSCGERYRSRFSEQDHGRFYCLDAFARHCALKKGHNQQQLDALRHDFEVLRSQGMESRCPYFGVFGGTYNENQPIPEMPESATEKKPADPVINKRKLPTCAGGQEVPIAVAEGRKPGCPPESWCRWDACRNYECRRRYRKCEPGVLQ